jgi:uncharacterized LabA/DUF88 family protein
MALRAAILVDHVNIYRGLCDLAPTVRVQGVNYNALQETALQEDVLYAAQTYLVELPDSRLDALTAALRSRGWRIRIKQGQPRPAGGMKADIDCDLFADAVRLCPRVDRLILASGDSDFVPLVDLYHERGKLVRVVSPRASTSPALIHAADDYRDLTLDCALREEIAHAVRT